MEICLFQFKHLHEAGDLISKSSSTKGSESVSAYQRQSRNLHRSQEEQRLAVISPPPPPLIKYHWSTFAALQRGNVCKGKLHPNHWTQKQNKRQQISLDSKRSLKERQISALLYFILFFCFNVRFKGKRQREDQRENLWKIFSSRNS